jgi:hypothetical protein
LRGLGRGAGKVALYLLPRFWGKKVSAGMVKCACGCGGERPLIDKKGRYRKYIHGHSPKGRYVRATIFKERVAHSRANEIVKRDKCIIGNFDCGGPLEVAHLDGDVFNNSTGNIVCLCACHHRLHDIGGMSMDEMMEGDIKFFYSDGKRRYLPRYSGIHSKLYGSGVGVPSLELAQYHEEGSKNVR